MANPVFSLLGALVLVNLQMTGHEASSVMIAGRLTDCLRILTSLLSIRLIRRIDTKQPRHDRP